MISGALSFGPQTEFHVIFITMKIRALNEAYLLRLERGEELIAALENFAINSSVDGGFFHGLGGAESAEIGLYTISGDKKYHFKKFSGDLEVVSLNGNIARDESGNVMVHCHATISGMDLKAYGGHVKNLVVGGTLELLIDLRPGAITRKLDDNIGLKLMNLDD